MNQLLLTVDVEALPARADSEHVRRLIWGHYEEGRAGIAEICDVIEEFGGIALFFLEVAGSVDNLSGYREINSFLARRGHIVEWHFHPEILGKAFWRHLGASGSTMRQDLFDRNDARIILQWGLEQFVRITGRRPQAYRAGSFRWNKHTLEFLRKSEIPFSFNACAETAVKDNYATFQPANPRPFRWENGVIEVPCGEILINSEIVHFRFPRIFPKTLGPRGLACEIASRSGGPVQVLLHSWSLLDRNQQGHFFFRSLDRQLAFRRMLSRLVKDCSIPSTRQEYFSVLEASAMSDKSCRQTDD